MVDLAKAKQRLAEKKQELEDLSDLSAEARDPVSLDQQSVGRLSRMDAMQQQAMAAAQSRRRAGRMRAIEAALRRMSDDEYGWCEECGEAIPAGRLELDPCAAKCVGCASG